MPTKLVPKKMVIYGLAEVEKVPPLVDSEPSDIDLSTSFSSMVISSSVLPPPPTPPTPIDAIGSGCANMEVMFLVRRVRKKNLRQSGIRVK